MKPGTMKAVLAIGVAMVLAACSSGGDGGGGGTTPAASPVISKLVDMAVANLPYTRSSSPGTRLFTGSGGEFQCLPGEAATFYYGPTNNQSIGNPLPCPSTPTTVTTVFLLGASSVTDPSVNNLAQLLMTLDNLANKPNPNALTIPNPLPPGYNPANVPPFNTANTTTFNTGLATAFPGTTLITTPVQAGAQLAQSLKTLTVTVVNNGTVTSNPGEINCPGTCSFVFQTGTAVTVTATGTGFQGWSANTGSANCAGTGTCAITLNADSSVTATFPAAPPPATLTINPNPGNGNGQVQCSVGGGAFGACATSYPNPTALTLRGVANSGSTFTGFSNGTGSINCTGTADCGVNLTADSSVTPTFTLNVTQFSVTANAVSSNGGTVTALCSAGGGAAATCGTYPVGTQISIIPSSNNANFTGWTNGNGSGLTANCGGATGPCNFQLTSNTSIQANFSRPVVSVTISGTGSVSSNPAGITNCTTNCSAPFDKGSSVTLMATGANFTGWSGGCSGTGNCVLNNLQANTSVSATFGVVSGSTTYKFVWAVGGSTAPLLAINPAAPSATPITAASTSGIAQTILTASYDSATQTFSSAKGNTVVYPSGGKLFKVDARTSVGVPGTAANPPVQLTNEIGIPSLTCDAGVIQNPAGTSIALYEFPGTDGDCFTGADNVLKSFPLSATATDPPGAFPPGLRINGTARTVYNLTTGQATHAFLVDEANSNTLKIVNLSTNLVTPIQANVGYVELEAQDTSDRVFLMSARFGLVNTRTLYVYTISTNTLTPLLTGTSDLLCGGDTCSDGTNLFVAEDAGKVYRVPLSATSSANVTTILNGTTPIQEVALTANRVFVVTNIGTPSATNNGLISLPKAGGTTTTHVTPGGDIIVRLFPTNNAVFYSQFLANTATIIAENGSVLVGPLPGRWLGGLTNPSFSVRSQAATTLKMALLNGAVAAGTPVVVYDAASPTSTPTVTMGPLPSTTPPVNASLLSVASFFGFFDNSMMGFAPLGGGGIGTTISTGVFFMDTTIPNSLALVPTPANQWQPALF